MTSEFDLLRKTLAPSANALTPAPFFVLRTPLLPFDETLRWGERPQAPRAADVSEQGIPAYHEIRQRLSSELLKFFSEPEMLEALYTCSPQSYRAVKRELRGAEVAANGGGLTRLEHSLVRYLYRMAGRTTPFALAAGYSIGTIGSRTTLKLRGRSEGMRHIRLSWEYCARVSRALGQSPEAQECTIFFPNSSIYRTGDKLTYAEMQGADSEHRHKTVSVHCTEELEQVLQRAAGGATRADLVGSLISQDVDEEDARSYVAQVIESQLLVSDFELAVTGEAPASQLLNRLARNAVWSNNLDVVKLAAEALRQIGCQPIGIDPQQYISLEDKLAQLPSAGTSSRVFAVDLQKPAETATIGAGVCADVMEGIEILRQIVPPTDALDQFRQAFQNRYEQREVKLSEVLDPEVGIGYPVPGADGGAPLVASSTTETERYERMLLRLVHNALEKGELSVELTDDALRRLRFGAARGLPSSFCASVSVAAHSQDALDRGEYQVCINTVVGPPAAKLLGRFCHDDPELLEYVRMCTEGERSTTPGVTAEIVHLPNDTIGDVVCRPVLREYELPYLSRSGIAPDRQLSVDDLYLSLEYSTQRLVLRSRRLGCEVVPRLSNAHNFGHLHSASLYRFLGMLQSQGTHPGFYWRWGGLTTRSAFLPRVTRGRLVLSRARWFLLADEFSTLGQCQGEQRFRAVKQWQQQLRLPRFVAVTDSDRELPIDFDNVLSVESFVELLKERAFLLLQELFPPPDKLAVTGPDGRYIHEILIPFRNTAALTTVNNRNANVIRSRNTASSAGSARRLGPGSKWLYVKYYTGPITADGIIQGFIGPLVRKLMANGIVDRWFFIRYRDRDHHVRLRMRCAREDYRATLLGVCSEEGERLLASGRIWCAQYDTYEREVERYGGVEAIGLAEEIFFHDSEAVVDIMAALPGDDGYAMRRLMVIRGIDMLLTDFRLEPEMKALFLRSLVPLSSPRRKDWAARYRRDRAEIAMVLDRHVATRDPYAVAIGALERRSEGIADAVRKMGAYKASGVLTTSIRNILASLAHMHVNRMLRLGELADELRLYDALHLYYKGRLARNARR